MDLPSPILSKDNYGKSRWTPTATVAAHLWQGEVPPPGRQDGTAPTATIGKYLLKAVRVLPVFHLRHCHRYLEPCRCKGVYISMYGEISEMCCCCCNTFRSPAGMSHP